MRINKCRVCYNKTLIKIGSLGKIAISNFTDTPQEKGRKFPLELVYCKKCTLLQLAHNTFRSLLYEDYWYQSHINPIIIADLKEIAGYGIGYHIDIGANDGTLLKYSNAEKKLAVDPSNIVPGDFIWAQQYWENFRGLEKADTITAIACVYDLPNPNKFMKNITAHLAPHGTFIAQLMTLQPFIENNDVGNICHEHLEYYSYKSLVRLYEQNGLEIFEVEKNSINGGSYRIFARHYQKGSIKFKEKEYGIQEFQDFFERIEDAKNKMIEFMDKYKVVGFGASTKMGTICQYYGISPEIIVDANKAKVGKFTVMGAKIVDKIPHGTEYLWVFPYGFIDYFKEKEKGYTGQWITTIPEFKVL